MARCGTNAGVASMIRSRGWAQLAVAIVLGVKICSG
jgi:hypothetical protein